MDILFIKYIWIRFESWNLTVINKCIFDKFLLFFSLFLYALFFCLFWGYLLFTHLYIFISEQSRPGVKFYARWAWMNFLFNLRNGFLFFRGRVEGEGEGRKERLVSADSLNYHARHHWVFCASFRTGDGGELHAGIFSARGWRGKHSRYGIVFYAFCPTKQQLSACKGLKKDSLLKATE